MRAAHLLLIALVAAAGCASDGDRPAQVGSAVIVTTTTTTTATTATTAPTRATDTASTTATGGTDATADAATTGTAGTSAEPPATTPTTAADVSSSTTPTTVAPVVGEPRVTTQLIAELDQPIDLAVRPGDPALYVVEQPGRIVRFDGASTASVLDVIDRVSDANEQGLLGLAFSPTGDLAYVNFTDRAGDTIVAEYPVSADGVLDPAGERVLLTVDQPYRNHNAGDLAFGPDGMLYITLGDGGSANDPERRSGDPSSLLGSLLRIDPTPTSDAAYSIPPDNPFADGDDGAPEVWSYGLRNPWKIAFDPVTDELWIADVGQNAFEEVDLVGPTDGGPAGRGVNFGWSAFEGTERFNGDVDPDGTTLPVLTYPHADDACSISGGAPYRGTAIPDLEPAYVYSDFCAGVVWALDLAGGRNLVLLDGLDQVTAVRTGPDGELYVLQRSGAVLRLVPG